MKTIIINNVEFTACTAIAVGIGDTERQNAVFVHDLNDEFRNGDFVAFGYDLPEDEDDAENILSDGSAQSTDWEDLETVRVDGKKIVFGVNGTVDLVDSADLGTSQIGE